MTRIITLIKKLFASGFIHIFGTTVINKILSLVGNIILLRIVSKEAYGVYTYAYNILNIMMIFSGLGVASAVVQCCTEAETVKKKREIYAFCCRIGITVNIIIALLTFFVAVFIPLPVGGAGHLLMLMCLIPVFTLATDLQRSYMRSELRNKDYAYSNTIASVLILLCSCGLCLAFQEKGLIAAQYFAYGMTAVIVAAVFKTPLRFEKIHLNRAGIRSVLGIAIISALNNGISHLMYLLDVFVLGICVPEGAVIASYKAATTIPMALVFIPTSVAIYVYPYFVKNRTNKTWLKTNYKRLALVMAGGSACLSVVLILLAPFIIRIIFGVQYLDSVEPFRILCVSFVFSSTLRILAGNVLVTQRKLKFNLFVSIFSSALNTVLNVVMINIYGANGAAIATLITAMVDGVMSTWYLQRTFNQVIDRT